MQSQKIFITQEPLLIESSDELSDYYLLPANTTLYFDETDEKLVRFYMYVNFFGVTKDALNLVDTPPGKTNYKAPISVRKIDSQTLADISQKYPLTRKQLEVLIKTSGMTKDEVVSIARSMPE